MIPQDRLWSIAPAHLPAAAAADIRQAFLAAGPVESLSKSDLPRALHIVEDTIAVIPIRGVMTKHRGFFQWLYGGYSMRECQEAIMAAAADEGIRRIVLQIESPGGAVNGLRELGLAVKAAAGVKSVIAQVDGMAASAAYYVAAMATEIRSGRMDLVGSIGTKMMLWDTTKWFEDAGVKPIPVDTGAFKSAGDDGVPITDEQVAYFQGIVDAYFADFREVVMAGRKLSEAEFKAVADGRVFIAYEMVGSLVDRLMTFDETMAELIDEAERERQTRRARQRFAESRA